MRLSLENQRSVKKNIKKKLKSFDIDEIQIFTQGRKDHRKTMKEYLQKETEFPENNKKVRHIFIPILHSTLRRVFYTLKGNVHEMLIRRNFSS